MANAIRLAGLALVLYVSAGLGLSAIQVAKAHADRVAVTLCEVSQDCSR
jgi:predicted O-methyltransferase YrrM